MHCWPTASRQSANVGPHSADVWLSVSVLSIVLVEIDVHQHVDCYLTNLMPIKYQLFHRLSSGWRSLDRQIDQHLTNSLTNIYWLRVPMDTCSVKLTHLFDSLFFLYPLETCDNFYAMLHWFHIRELSVPHRSKQFFYSCQYSICICYYCTVTQRIFLMKSSHSLSQSFTVDYGHWKFFAGICYPRNN